MNEFEYPLVIGNIIHETFERLLITRNFEEANLEEVFKESMKNHFCHLHRLKETEEKVLRDLKIASTNIKLWI
jgi:predicted nucleotidyltransferase